MMKENFAASVLAIPKSNAMKIVEPERERPGQIASICIIPMSNAITTVISLPVLFPRKLSAMNNKVAVTNNAMVGTQIESKRDSKKSPKNTPAIAAGIDAITINPTYFWKGCFNSFQRSLR